MFRGSTSKHGKHSDMEIFQFDFMLRAFAAGIAIATIAPLIGVFLVVKRYSLMADTLAHVSLAGVALGLLANIHPLAVTVLATVLASIGIEKLRERRRIFGESALALFLSASLAFAVVLISAVRGFNADLFGVLFGSISTVTLTDLYLIGILSAGIIALMFAFYKELFFVSFDEELAQASGVNSRAFNLLIVIMAAVAIAISIRIIGILLIGALMVIPVMTAMQFARSFKQTVILSVLFSLSSVIAGLFASFYLNLASGGTIVLISAFIFLASLAVKR